MWHERLEKDTKVGEDYKKIVITSIFLAESVAEGEDTEGEGALWPASGSQRVDTLYHIIKLLIRKSYHRLDFRPMSSSPRACTGAYSVRV
jgi:hypothetical protein